MGTSRVAHQRRNRERGAVALLAAILLMVVGGFVALSLNAGHKMLARTQLQTAVDSAALAGAGSLIGMAGTTTMADGTVVGAGAARDTASGFAAAHVLDSSPVLVDRDNDVVLGYWDPFQKVFHPPGDMILFNDEDNGNEPVVVSNALPQFLNAIQVKGLADSGAGHNSRLGVIFGGFVGGVSAMGVGSSALVIAGGPCQVSGRVLPMVIPACALADGQGSTQCGTTITFPIQPPGASGQDRQVGLVDLTDESRTATKQEIITQNGSARDGDAPDVPYGKPVAVLPSNQYDRSVADSYAPMLCTSDPTTCPTWQVGVVSVDCHDPMPQRPTIIGFATVSVIDAEPSATRPGAAPSVTVYINCTQKAPANATWGCPLFGFRAPHIRLTK
jgi:Flp pilus assembly protein TadG